MLIRDWVERVFAAPEPKLILEVGAYDGKDTAWLARLPGARVHAFEPAPQNRRPAGLPLNVTWHQTAVGDRCGVAPFIPSVSRGGRPWAKSGSLRRPTGHLAEHPDIRFGAPVEVPVTTLDAFAEQWLPPGATVDLIWCDVQGAEGDVLRGGRAILARTRFLVTEYSDVEMYQGQPSLREILGMLPDWLVACRWTYDVLLERFG